MSLCYMYAYTKNRTTHNGGPIWPTLYWETLFLIDAIDASR